MLLTADEIYLAVGVVATDVIGRGDTGGAVADDHDPANGGVELERGELHGAGDLRDVEGDPHVTTHTRAARHPRRVAEPEAAQRICLVPVDGREIVHPLQDRDG